MKWKKYVQASALVSVKHVLYGCGAALCSVSNYIEHALQAVCNDINEEVPQKPTLMSKDMN